MANLPIINARFPGYKGLQTISVDAVGKISAIAPMSTASVSGKAIDAGGDWLSLGGVDLQINGALGLAFTDVETHHRPILEKICRFLWQQGIDGFCPTLVTTSVENIRRSLDVFAEFMATFDEPQAAKVLGVHLEGPFLNPKKRGAHPEEFLLPLTVENVDRVLGDRADVVKIITLAPELDETGKTVDRLQSLGITISLGHSLATEEEANSAFDRGATMVTHAFNAMPSLHHRQPGLLAAAIVRPEVRCGLIADGVHVQPTMVKILLQASQFDKGIFLVSDALAPLGLPDGTYPWDSREIEVKQGTARLLDGTLSGTTLPLFSGVQNLVNWGICDLETAIALATVAPREAVGIEGAIGADSSQLIRWHQEGTVLEWKRFKQSNSE